MPPEPDTYDYVGTGEATNILGVEKTTLYRWMAAGRIKPVTKLPGRNGAYLFERGDVERLAVARAD